MLESGNAAVFTAGVRGNVPVQACDALVTVRFGVCWIVEHKVTARAAHLLANFIFFFFFDAILKSTWQQLRTCCHLDVVKMTWSSSK